MMFVMWLAWCVSVFGTPSYDDVDSHHEARQIVQPSEDAARAALQEREKRIAAR